MNRTLYSLLAAGTLVCTTAAGAQSAGRVPADAVVSPRGDFVVWLRELPDSLVRAGGDIVPAVELLTAKRDGSNRRVLVHPRGSGKPDSALANLSDPRFSPDGGTIFFSSAAWTTSDAVHAVNIASGATRFIAPGNWYEVVPRGRFAGYLLVEQHRYREEGGSYEAVSLFSPAGRLVQLVTEGEALGNPGVQAWRRVNIPAP